jgi:hypothetical protein
MKNVTKILTAVVFCAAIFASQQRIDALGGNAALWPGDEANIAAFPAQVNNHAYLQFTGVADGTDGSTGAASLLFQKDGTAWGFNYGQNDDWVNMHWGDGSMGVTVGMESTTGASESGDASDMSVGWGKSFDWGEVGVQYATTDNGDGDATLAFNWRDDFGFWIFDNTVVSVGDLMADDLAFGGDFFSHMDAGGADVVFGWGVDYDGAAGTPDTMVCDDGSGNMTAACDDAVDVYTMKQTATIGVEANMTDWATLRAGYNWSHALACDNGDADDDSCGENWSGFSWGLGFNWGGLTADFSVSSGLLQDPIGTITGYGSPLTSDAITLTYSF